MQQLFLGNFEFEYQLAGLKQTPPPLKRITQELTYCWLGLARQKDRLLIDSLPEEDFSEHLKSQGLECPRLLTVEELNKSSDLSEFNLIPWGWSEAALKFAHTHRFTTHAPSIESVRRINHRQWAAEQEAETISQLVYSLTDLEKQLQSIDPSNNWVLKSGWGMSGRDRISGSGHHLPEAVRNWAKKRLTQSSPLIWEQWLTRIEEVGIQIEIPDEGEPKLIDIVPMLVDRNGQYRGSLLLPLDQLKQNWNEAIQQIKEVAMKIQSAGYYGPVGFDVMRYQADSGEPLLRVHQDINARYTMGRLASGFRRYLTSQEQAAWVHFSCKAETRTMLEDWWNQLADSLPRQFRCLRTSPFLSGDKPVHHQTALLIGDQIEQFDFDTVFRNDNSSD